MMAEFSQGGSLSLLALCVYTAIELLFCALFHLYLVPRANRRTVASAYRDYGADRQSLLFRILDRSAAFAAAQGMEPREGIKQYVLGCFYPTTSFAEGDMAPQITTVNEAVLSAYLKQQNTNSLVPWPLRLSQESMDSTLSDDSKSISSIDDSVSEFSSTDVDESNNPSSTWTVEGVGRDDVDALMCWSLFGKNNKDFEPWEHQEKQNCFDQLEKRLGLVFAPGSSGQYQPRRLNMEDVDPLHRPLLVYLIVIGIKIVVGLILRLAGYQRVVSQSTGLVAWYRPARGPALLPMLFFHGIAPGGLLFYLPIILLGLGADGRAMFLFENHNISCTLSFKALSESETADGVAEIVDQFLPRDRELSICGHSFGSFAMTWLLHSDVLRHRIRQYALLDPASILLSERDVMANFLYKKDVSKFRMVAASELFTEYFLRRHFYFYNSELWLEDIPDSVKVLVCVSENDEIVNARRVNEFVKCFGNSDSFTQIFWNGVGHGCCVTSPQKWREIKDAMLRQELAIVQQTQE